MRSDNPTTTTDVDSILTQESSVNKNEIQLKTENQNKVWKNFHKDPNVVVNQILLSRLSNYQVSMLYFFLFSHTHMFRIQDLLEI